LSNYTVVKRSAVIIVFNS